MKILLTILLLGSSALAQDQAAVERALGACGPIGVRFDVHQDPTQHPLGQPEPGKALVYVIQEGKIVCFLCSTTTRVGMDGSWVGANDGNSYFFFNVAPGEHHLCVDQQIKSADDIRTVSLNFFTAEAGKTYYLRARVRPNYNLQLTGEGSYPTVSWILDLDPINSDEGQYLVAASASSVWRLKK